jgi:hypothetical protein
MSLAKELLEKYIKVDEVSKELTARVNAKASYLYSDERPTNRSYMRAAFNAQGNTGKKTYAEPGDKDHTDAKQYFQSLMKKKRDGKSNPLLKDRHAARTKDYDTVDNPEDKHAKDTIGNNTNAIKARGGQHKPIADAKPYLDYYQKFVGHPIQQMSPEERQKKLLPINGEPKGGWRYK